jgi:hypothetical protein
VVVVAVVVTGAGDSVVVDTISVAVDVVVGSI